MAHFLLDPFEKIRAAEELADRVKSAPALVAGKLKESQAGPICVGAAIGFLSGVIIGIVLSPVKNGINIASNNTFGAKEKKHGHCCRMNGGFDEFEDFDAEDEDVDF